MARSERASGRSTHRVHDVPGLQHQVQDGVQLLTAHQLCGEVTNTQAVTTPASRNSAIYCIAGFTTTATILRALVLALMLLRGGSGDFGARFKVPPLGPSNVI